MSGWCTARRGSISRRGPASTSPGLELPPAKVNLWSYVHGVELVWLFIDLEGEFGSDAVRTEREIRALEFRAGSAAERSRKRHRPRYALARRDGPRSPYFPDLVVDGGAAGGGTLFVELELSVKASERRRAIVRDYELASQVGGVRYYAAGDAFAGMRRTVEGERAGGVIDLRLLGCDYCECCAWLRRTRPH